MGQYTGIQKGGQNDPLLLVQSPKMTVQVIIKWGQKVCQNDVNVIIS